MEDPKEMITTSVSDAELERRWKAVREMMRANRIDFLLMRNDEEFLGGYVKWFTDIPARHSYPYTVIFPVNEEMTLISPGAAPPGERPGSGVARRTSPGTRSVERSMFQARRTRARTE